MESNSSTTFVLDPFLLIRKPLASLIEKGSLIHFHHAEHGSSVELMLGRGTPVTGYRGFCFAVAFIRLDPVRGDPF